MKYLLAPLLFIGSLLFSSEIFSEEIDTQRNFKPCQIMMDQFDSFAKIDPLKGESSDYFTDWNDNSRKEERQHQAFIIRAMKPGIGKAYFYPEKAGVENLGYYFENENVSFSSAQVFFDKVLRDYGLLHFYNLSTISDYLVITTIGPEDTCIKIHTWKTTKTNEGYLLSESEPGFTGEDLCSPSDVAVVNVDGTDYLLVSSGTGSDAEEKNIGKDYLFHMELFPLGIEKSNLSECSFYVRLKITGNGMGLYAGTNPAPRHQWK